MAEHQADDWITPGAAPPPAAGGEANDWAAPPARRAAPPPKTAAPESTGGMGRNFRAGLTEFFTGMPQQLSAIGNADDPFLRANDPISEETKAAGRDALTHGINQGLGAYNPEKVTTDGLGENAARFAGMGLGAALIPGPGEEALLGRGADMAGNVVSRAANAPLKTFGRKVLTNVAASSAGGTAAHEVPDDMPVTKLVTAAAASILGGGATEIPGMLKGLGSASRRAVAPLSMTGRDQMAADTLRARSSNPSALLTNLDQPGHELVPGSTPTTGQAAGDMGILSLEREQATKSPAAFLARREDQNAARRTALTGIQHEGDPEAVSSFLKGHFQQIDDQAQQHADTLTARAQAAAGEMGGAGIPEQHGLGIRDALQQAENTSRAAERSLWKAVDPDNTVRIDAAPTFKAAAEIEKGMSRMAAPMEGDERGIFEAIQGDKNLSLGELGDLRSRVSSAMRAELTTNGRSPAYARLTQLRGAIQNNLSDAAAGKVAEQAEAVAKGEMPAEDTVAGKIRGWLHDYQQRRASGAAGVGEDTAEGTPHAGGHDASALPADRGPGNASGAEGLPEGAGLVEKPLTESQFYKNYVQHIDISGRKGDPIATRAKIMEDGFEPKANVNSLPPYRGGEPQNVVDQKFQPKKGDMVYLAPKDAWKDAPNGPEIQKGWKPKPYEAIHIQDDEPRSMYDRYVEALKNHAEEARAPSGGGAAAEPVLKDKLETNFAPEAAPEGAPNPTPIDQAAADRLSAATQATKERAGTFGQGPVKDALAKAGQQDLYKLPEAKVPDKFFHSGPTSPSDIRKLRKVIGPERADALLSDFAAASLRKAAENPDGTIDPAKAAAWRTKYSGALTEYPELADKLSDASKATVEIARAAKAQKQALVDRNATALGRVMKEDSAGDVTKAIGSMLSGQGGQRKIADLARAVSADPEAKQGLRQAVADHIAQNLVSNTEAGTSGENLIKSDAFQSFVKKNRGALAQVFEPEEMKTLDAIAADLNRANRSIVAAKLPGQSNTAQDVLGVIRNDPQSSVFTKLLAEFGVGGAGFAVGHLPGAMAAYGGTKIFNAMHGAGMEKVDQLVTEALLDPVLAKNLLRRAPARETPASGQPIVARLRRLGLATAGALYNTQSAPSPRD